MNKLRHIWRVMNAWWSVPNSLWWHSRRLEKFAKKNRKEQDPFLYPYQERYDRIKKVCTRSLKRLGIKVKLVGEENIPKGGMWITPNHTSNFDAFYIFDALAHKVDLVSVARKDLGDRKALKGYFTTTDSFFLDRSSPRQALQLLTGAAKFAKEQNRGIVLFPEGTRSLTTELLEFKDGSFRFPQKFYLPIVPVTITGTLQAKRWWELNERTVTVTVHPPIKGHTSMSLSTEIISKRVRETIQNELTRYENSLSPKEKERLVELKKKAAKQDKKRAKRVKKHIELDAKVNSWRNKRAKKKAAKLQEKSEKNRELTKKE